MSSGEGSGSGPTGNPAQRRSTGYEHVGDIELEVSVQLGRRRMPLGQVGQLRRGDLIVLDRAAGEAVEVRVNDLAFAEGEIVVLRKATACRITRLV